MPKMTNVCTVYVRILGHFPAINTVHTPCIYMVLASLVLNDVGGALSACTACPSFARVLHSNSDFFHPPSDL